MYLKDLAEVYVGVPIARYKYNENKDAQKFNYQLFSQNMLSDTAIFRNAKAEIFYANKDLSNSCTKQDDVIFGLRKPNQAIFIADNATDLLVQSYFAVIRCDKSKVLSEYLAFKLNTVEVHNQLFKNIQGGAIPLVKIQDVKNIKLKLPSLEQQAKAIEMLKTGYQEIDVLRKLIEEKQKILKVIV
ncbi:MULTISPECIES: restriction endonuclease subunit S [Francisella]|uniref:restriction endonuclease subunit S n=1 Tax=Francisella TaxID=262 RepID=UPI0008FCAAF1|nr:MULTISPECIES: restriction endonuclease subunit S [Francisella]APC91666.1 hypothetical protein BBG19_0930 [Francisella sp. MA067296]